MVGHPQENAVLRPDAIGSSDASNWFKSPASSRELVSRRRRKISQSRHSPLFLMGTLDARRQGFGVCRACLGPGHLPAHSGRKRDWRAAAAHQCRTGTAEAVAIRIDMTDEQLAAAQGQGAQPAITKTKREESPNQGSLLGRTGSPTQALDNRGHLPPHLGASQGESVDQRSVSQRESETIVSKQRTHVATQIQDDSPQKGFAGRCER